MQLSPSNIPPIDSNLLALQLPGAASAMAPKGDSALPSSAIGTGGDGDELLFEQLLPETGARAENSAAMPGLVEDASEHPAEPEASSSRWSALSSTRFLRAEAQQRVGDNALHQGIAVSSQTRFDGIIQADERDVRFSTSNTERPLRRELRPKDEGCAVASELPPVPLTLPNSDFAIQAPQADDGSPVVDERENSEPVEGTSGPDSSPQSLGRKAPPTVPLPLPQVIQPARNQREHGVGTPASDSPAREDLPPKSEEAPGRMDLAAALPAAPQSIASKLAPASPGIENAAATPDEAEIVVPPEQLPDGNATVGSRWNATSGRVLPADAASGRPEVAVPLAPFADAEPRLLRDEANFAEAADEFRVNFAPERCGAQKTFVSAQPEELTPHIKALGIDVAKRAATMSSRALPTPTSHPAFEYAAVAASEPGAAAASALAEASVAASQNVSTPQRAVEAVLRAVDHVATRHQHAVNLRFSIGDSDLNVRVELRADEVRTTFSTDSAELRSALSEQWHALAHAGADGTLRLAPATFTSATDQPPAQTLSGDASSRGRQHRDEPHDHASRDARELFNQNRAGFSSSADHARAEVRPSSPFTHAGSRHLHTLA